MKLKHLFYAAFAGAFAFTITSCEDIIEDLGSPMINVEPSVLEFEAGEGSQTVELTATLNWNVVTDLSGKWVALSKESGEASKEKQTISVSVEANSDYDRSMDIVFSAGGMVKATLKVNQKGSQGSFVAEEGDGSLEKPFNVAQAAEAASKLTWTNKDDYEKVGPYYIKGKISAIEDAYSANYGNATFTITDTGENLESKLKVYRAYYLENKKWKTGNTQIEVGDVVVVYGEIMNYSNNTPETVQKGSYLYSLNGETVAGGEPIDYENAPAKTVAEFIAAADKENYYKLTGKVSKFSSQYCSFDLTDETGTIYVYSVENKADWVDSLSNGGTVVLAGLYTYYEAKQQHEVIDAQILSFEPAAAVDYENAPAKTVDEFIKAADKTTYYKLTGTVSRFNSQYCSFDLTDETGTIYVYSVDNKAAWADKISNGGTIVLAGLYEYYAAKEQHEVVNAQILSFEEGAAIDYNNAPEKSVADFIAAADKQNYYKLTGTVSRFSSQYCSFDLTDETGTIYVYSVENKAEWKDKIKDGGTVVLAGLYEYYAAKEQHEVVHAQILSFEEGAPIDYNNAPEKSVAEFIAAADKENYYKLTGTVSGFSSQYCSFDLTDETGTIYVYSVENKAEWKDKIKDGGTVVLAGLYEYYAAKEQHEVVHAQILSFEEGAPIDYNNAPEKSVAEFIAAADKENYYKLTGTVSKFNSQYCSFDLTDETGTIYVYSVENKAEWKDKIKDGGTVVLAGLYDYYAAKEQHEVVKAQILSFEEGAAVDYNNAPEKSVADFIAAADKENYYKLTGTVSKFNSQYCSFDLTDETGTIYVYSVENKADWKDQLSDGGTVVLAGLYDYYAAKEQHEVIKAQILSFIPGEDPGVLEVKSVTIEEFNAASESSTQAYKLHGKISNIENTVYGNFYLTDETGTVYVYGLTATELGYGSSNDKSFASLGLNEGDVITIIGYRGSYNGKIEVLSAYFVEKTGTAAVFGVENTAISVNASSTEAVIKVKGNVDWTASSTLSLDKTSGSGAAEIKASFEANTDTVNVKTYSVTIKTDADVDVKEYVVLITQDKALEGGAQSITINLTNANAFEEEKDLGSPYKQGFSATVEGFKVATYKYASTSNPITPDATSMRIYKSAVFYISAPSGKSIKALVFKGDNSSSGKYILDLTGVEGTEGTAVADKAEQKIKWEGNAGTVVLQANAGQTRVVNVEVYYE